MPFKIHPNSKQMLLMTLDDVEKSCGVCKHTQLTILEACTNCYGIMHCSRACKAADEEVHALLCEKYRTEDWPDAEERWYRAVYFDDRVSEPKFAWAHRIPHDTLILLYLPDGLRFPSPPAEAGRIRFARYEMNDNLPGPRLQLYYLDSKSGYVARHSNRGIDDSVDVHGNGGRPWAGPVLVLKEATDSQALEDVTMADFRSILDWFLRFPVVQYRLAGYNTFQEYVPTQPPSLRLLGG